MKLSTKFTFLLLFIFLSTNIQARFTQSDKWIGIDTNPGTLHKYLYAGSDPVNNIDPTGKFSLAEIGAANSVRSTLSEMQINIGIDLLGDGNGSSNATLLLGVAALGGAASFKLLQLLSRKFRKNCNSFTGDTLVSTENGLKEISIIKIGDLVWSYNEKNKDKSLQEVIHLIQRKGKKEIINITLETGEIISTTSEHPFYTLDKVNEWSWTEAENLAIGSVLLDSKGYFIKILDIQYVQKIIPVFNLTVDKYHTFFIGKSNILVHNAECKIFPGGTTEVDPKNLNVFGSTQPELYKSTLDTMVSKMKGSNASDFWREALKNDGPIMIWVINEKRYLFNGNHRFHAAKLAGVKIPVDQIKVIEKTDINIPTFKLNNMDIIDD